MATQEEDRLVWLVQRVFNTQEGQDLLDAWELQYCRGLGDDNALKMARKVGRADFITEVKSLSKPEQ